MNGELVQSILDIVFSDYFPYIAPALFLFMAALFADKIIDSIVHAVTSRRWR